MYVVGEAHVTNIAVHPDHRRHRDRHPAARRSSPGRCHRPGLRGLDAGGPGRSTGAQALYRSFGSAPAGEPPRYYEDTEDAIVMWCHDIQTAATRQLDELRSAPMTDDQVDGLTLTDAEAGPDTLLLGIETSCDETAAALVMGGSDVVSSVVSSQIELHAPYGGVVPEIASRAHLDLLNPVDRPGHRRGRRRRAAHRRRGVHVGPGLIGALLVGVSAAKALALAWDVPFVAVNHLEAHLYAALLDDPTIELPIVVLLVSGGHTMLVEMRAPAATGCSARRSTTPPARRSTRSPASSASGTRAARRSSASPSTATRPPSTSRGRCATTASTSASAG